MAMDDEMSALISRGTWELVEVPPNADIVACRWVFTLKFRANRTLKWYKARLVAKGFTQTYGVDYFETFSPIACLNSIAYYFPWQSISTGRWEKQRMVCKLKKAIYGLKQSPSAWFDKFSRIIGEFGFLRCQIDHSVFVQTTKSGMVVLAVYVDDILITGSDIVGIEEAKTYLQKHFVTKDLGRPKYFLGIKIAYSKHGVSLSQRKYACDLFQEAALLGTKPKAYYDVDYAGSKDDRKSTFGYYTYVGGNLVTWSSKKQTTVARSSAEAEYQAMAHTISEILGLKNLLKELGFMYKDPVPMHCDNQAAIHIACNPIFHERTKHIEVDCNFVHEAIMS
ncbi:UNVERIFIED_CONTAM: Retrovirus-related Pol polyprotein from transposon RE1 [Sesamum angustifolium]|uniref:Retrovirus-related Pol polyprotein from transposon RE1 n=1 Tax=Sesamum angustifolium TaxID=2727405 RepID=A0AAW2J2Z9_9LAMI